MSTLTQRHFTAWLVHLLTASTAIFAIMTIQAIIAHDYRQAFAWMGAAIFVDAIDGTLARKVNVMTYAPQIDGALLDNIVDYINYVLTPVILLLVHPNLLPGAGREVLLSLVVLSSAYQFTHKEAKTADHFFKGFPSYWNFVVFYMVIFGTSAMTNALVLVLFSVLVFIPIKYVYPSRMDYLTHHPLLRRLMLALSILFGVAALWLLFTYPNAPEFLKVFSIFYFVWYFGFSLYRTLVPLERP
jgi:phosphatidylcholine synthase